MKITVLGSGSAYGVPMIFNSWSKANPNNPKDKRTRASLFIEDDNKSILIDAGPDLLSQINTNNITNIDSVLITHGHYDHMIGLPELLRASKLQNHSISIYASSETMTEIKNCYSYLFKDNSEPESQNLIWQTIPDYGEFKMSGLSFDAMQVTHHQLHPTAIRYKNFAYVTDWQIIPEKSKAKLHNLDLLIIECNNGLLEEINGHSNLNKIKELAKEINPKQVFLSHISAKVDTKELEQALPKNYAISYDTMNIEV